MTALLRTTATAWHHHAHPLPTGPMSPDAERRPPVMTPAITITPVHVADLVAEGELMPVYVHVIDHPEGRVLVDTGITALHPLVADMDPRLRPWSEQDIEPAGIDVVVNTHLHFDHCGEIGRAHV